MYAFYWNAPLSCIVPNKVSAFRSKKMFAWLISFELSRFSRNLTARELASDMVKFGLTHMLASTLLMNMPS